jgi:hypothetical protein
MGSVGSVVASRVWSGAARRKNSQSQSLRLSSRTRELARMPIFTHNSIFPPPTTLLLSFGNIFSFEREKKLKDHPLTPWN